MRSDTRRPVILMVDDDEQDRQLAEKAAAECYPEAIFITLPDGKELDDYLHRRGPYVTPSSSPRPGILLLDLRLPGKDGWELVAEIKADAQLRRIPVLALTHMDDEESISRGYDAGVNAFIRKPFEYDYLCRMIGAIGDFWFHTVQLANMEGEISRPRRNRWNLT